MDLPSFIDEDVLQNPMYWLLTFAAEIALLIGFKAQSLWGTEIGMPIMTKIITLALVPLASYVIIKKFQS